MPSEPSYDLQTIKRLIKKDKDTDNIERSDGGRIREAPFWKCLTSSLRLIQISPRDFICSTIEIRIHSWSTTPELRRVRVSWMKSWFRCCCCFCWYRDVDEMGAGVSRNSCTFGKFSMVIFHRLVVTVVLAKLLYLILLLSRLINSLWVCYFMHFGSFQKNGHLMELVSRWGNLEPRLRKCFAEMWNILLNCLPEIAMV